ncbi:hypothetical protein IT072_02335 [Leifsonia sp. ZF2019]|uniref:hypothetical protein n=1 Tax=Leifsonia sp. ZF2019 TaxID=2781978 RepID=UPI001CBAA626|nr:hypothetical protein [Leifsonia sp. ZF2019]UAJ78305.1 hypothetical protein IT072_13660 [Leifsonia sp. ZF2019]UAJ79935.1 hypothetical protein IT072_02335 [Leifsonia sp. ZF2019]
MSNTQGEDKAVSVRAKLIGGAAVITLLAAAGITVGVSAHAAQVKADAEHAMTVAAPAYQGAIDHGGSLDTLGAQSVQAKKDYDAEQARLAAEKAAQEAAAAQAAAEAAQAAADEAARQAAEQQQSNTGTDDSDSSGGSSGSSKLPAGSPVPWIPNPDPQDTAGGRWDTSACASGSASGNPAVCD